MPLHINDFIYLLTSYQWFYISRVGIRCNSATHFTVLALKTSYASKLFGLVDKNLPVWPSYPLDHVIILFNIFRKPTWSKENSTSHILVPRVGLRESQFSFLPLSLRPESCVMKFCGRPSNVPVKIKPPWPLQYQNPPKNEKTNTLYQTKQTNKKPLTPKIKAS